MKRDIRIDALWDDESHVWVATSSDVDGLVVEASSWAEMIETVRALLPELLQLNGEYTGDLALTFRAETHLDLASA